MLDKNIKLDSIGGYEYQKKEAYKIVNFFKNYDKYVKNGASLPRGVIFYGRPGTGKTMFATAIANESKANLYSLTDERFYDNTNLAQSVQNTFIQAKKHAPSIILLDELDQLVNCERYSMSGPSDKQREMLRLLLTEIDKLNNTGVLVIATANTDIREIPPSLVRNGRIEKHIAISTPDFDDRKSILEIYLRKSKVFDNIKSNEIAKITAHFTGSSISTLVNDVLIKCLADNKAKATYEDFYDPIQTIISQGIKRKPKKNNDSVIYHEIGHLIANYYLNHEYGFISTESFGDSGGRFSKTIVNEEKELNNYDDIKKQCIVAIAGLAATEIFTGKKCLGAQGDISNILSYFNATLGNAINPSRKLCSIYLYHSTVGLRIEPNQTSPELVKGFDSFMNDIYEEAKKLITAHRSLVKKFYKELKVKKSLSSEEVEAILKH